MIICLLMIMVHRCLSFNSGYNASIIDVFNTNEPIVSLVGNNYDNTIYILSSQNSLNFTLYQYDISNKILILRDYAMFSFGTPVSLLYVTKRNMFIMCSLGDISLYIIDIDRQLKRKIDYPLDIQGKLSLNMVKCLQHSLSNQTIIGLVETNYLLYSRDYFLEQTTLNLGRNIVLKGITINNDHSNLLYGLVKVNKTFGIMVIEEINALLNIKSLSMIEEDTILYDQVELAFISSGCIGIISYQKQTNHFTYYLLNNKNSQYSIKLLRPHLSSLHFPNAEIERIDLINSGQFMLVYMNRGNGNQYLTVIDLLYNIVIYSEGRRFNNATYNSYLFISDKNNLIRLCPFIEVNNNCSYTPSNNHSYFTILNQENINYFSPCHHGYKLGMYCVERCPYGYTEHIDDRLCYVEEGLKNTFNLNELIPGDNRTNTTKYNNYFQMLNQVYLSNKPFNQTKTQASQITNYSNFINKANINNECPNNTYPEEGICWECLCFNNFTCSTSKSCNCKTTSKDISYSGEFCQISYQNDVATQIKVLSNVISTEDNYFAIDMSLSDKDSIKWIYQPKKSDCLNNLEEEFLVVRSECFINSSNLIMLEVNNQTENIIKLNIVLEVSYPNYLESLSFDITSENNPKPMVTIFKFLVNENKTINDKLYYSLTYMDKFGEELAITPFTHNTSIETVFPYLTELYIQVRNDRGEKTNKTKKEVTLMKTDEYTDTIESILQDDNIRNGNKIKKLIDYCLFGKNMFSKEELDQVKQISVDASSEIIENKIKKESNDMGSYDDYIQLNHVFALLNYILYFNHNESNIVSNSPLNCTIGVIEEIILNIIKQINSRPSIKIGTECYKSILRDIDTIIIFNIENNRDPYHKVVKESLSILRGIISRDVFPGEQQYFIGHKVSMFFDRPGIKQEAFKIPDQKYISNNNNLSNYIKGYGNKQKNISLGDTLLFIKKNEYQNIKNELEYIHDVLIKETVIGVIKLAIYKEKNINNYTAATETEINVNVYSLKYNKAIDIKFFKYDIFFPCLMDNSIDTPEKRSSIACIIRNSTSKSDNYSCYTFFDESRLICRCQISDYITLTNNLSYANISKQDQFKLRQVNYFNIISIPLICSSLFLVMISSIILLFYDIYQDKKNYTMRLLSEDQFRRFIFKVLNHLKSSNTLSFALYMAFYQYPCVDVFSIYTIQHPRFLRFFKEIVLMLFILLFSLMPFYFTEFQLKKEFINNREYSAEDINIDNLEIYPGVMIKVFWISFFISLLVRMCSYISFLKVTDHSHMKTLIYNPIKNKYKEFIYNEVKKDILLNDNWLKIKMRILAVNRLCGKHLPRCNDDKVLRYLNYKRQSEIQSENVKPLLVINGDMQDENVIGDGSQNPLLEIDSHFRNTNKSAISYPLLPSVDNKKIALLNPSQEFLDYRPDSINQRYSLKIQSRYSFTLTKNPHISVSQHTAKRFKAIASNYIYNKNNALNSSIGSPLDSPSIEIECFSIEKQPGYSYFSHQQINTVDHLLNSRRTLTRVVIAFIILGLILIGNYSLMCVVLKEAFNEYRFYLIKAWLLPSLTQMIVLGSIMHYLSTLLATVLIFHFRKQRKKYKIIGLFYRLFVGKQMIDMYKIRNIITKYHREFE